MLFVVTMGRLIVFFVKKETHTGSFVSYCRDTRHDFNTSAGKKKNKKNNTTIACVTLLVFVFFFWKKNRLKVAFVFV